MSNYHTPVMLEECLEALNIAPDKVYADLTFGGGGHSKAILERLSTGKLYGIDQDDDAARNAEMIQSSNFAFVATNFRHIKKYLKLHGCTRLDGILADLGVSSHQIDAPERGFSTRFNGVLDMRMDRSKPFSARELVNQYSEKDLHRLLGMYGEIRNAKTLADAIVSARSVGPIETVDELKKVLDRFAPKHREFKYYAQVFQALRIEVNDELKALEDMLEQAVEMLTPGGRLVVMTYHSLEDRIVKNFINKGKFYGEVEKDLFGNEIKPLRAVNKKPIEASEEEVARNPRARSAKLRIAEKI